MPDRFSRREAIASGAAIGVAAAGAPAHAAGAGGNAAGPPMPSPAHALPDPLPVADPDRVRLERGWSFHEGDVPVPPPVTHNDTYLRAKAGNAAGAAAPAFDDSGWRTVRLPHDWAAAQPFDRTANVSQGYRRRGIGWYRCTLALEPADRDKRIELHFDGIATACTIWVNGTVVAHGYSGYTGIVVDLTPFARFGEERNVVAIRVDADAMEGWWYEGAGLYRHVWLVRRAAVAIVTDGVHCDPRRDPDGRWRVPVEAVIASVADAPATAHVEAVLLAPDGAIVARTAQAVIVGPLDEAAVAMTLDAGKPPLWSVDTPVLHTVVVRVLRDGAAVSERRVAIGFRTVRFDPDRGCLLNDRPVKLKGVCLHQDHAGVGVAVPDTLLAWRLGRLKAMGCNAIRCTHGAPAAELLDLCDRMGFLVMDENRSFNPAPDTLAQLRWMVRRDRNHPSVILWSVFNEEPMQATEAGVAMTRRMVHAVRALDASRPITAAMNGAFLEPVSVSAVVDVTGFNYYQDDYDRFHRAFPTRAMTSSEDTSAYETRGAYASDPAAHVVAAYDGEAASWGDTHRATWRKIAERPFVAGGFVWTGFDYHGEPTPFDWPTASSLFGILDLCGFAKTAFDIRRAQWVDDAAVVAIAPHWTWPGREGRPIRVLVTSNAEAVSLRLNGRDLGRRPADRIMGVEWSVPYVPGRLEALAWRGGRIVARAVHETAGPPVALRLTPARIAMRGDGEDAQPVTVDAVDARGRHVPTAGLPVRFAVTGGAIIGLGNGDPNSHEPEQGDARSLFNGLAQVIVRAGEAPGRLRLCAEATGLRAAETAVALVAAPPPAQAGVTVAAQRIGGWRRSPAFAARPDPALAPRDGDNNSWAFVQDGTPLPAGRAGWRVYAARVTPWQGVAVRGGTIRFARIGGTAELWADGVRLAVKSDATPAPLEAPLPPGAAPRRLALLVEAAGGPSGPMGPTTIVAR